ncbi:MAG TPA: hypothetical protein VGG45_19840 [Terracidiphilus sp.]
MRSSTSLILVSALFAAYATVASAAHSKPRSVELLDAVFQTSAPGTIEASVNPPIQGVLRIVVRANPSGASGRGSKANNFTAEDADQIFTIEVTQSDRPIPYRLVNRTERHHPAVGLVADIDVNDLTPGLPVRVRVHSVLQDPPALNGRAYAVY